MNLTARIKSVPKLTAKFKELKMPLSGGFEEGYEQGYADGVASVPDYLEQLMNDTLTEYRNEKATAIKVYLFSENKTLETVDFPSVTSVGERAFYNCSALKDVNIPLAESIGAYCFQGTKIVEANFPNATGLPTGVFFSCGTITTALFPKSKNVGGSMFRGCSKLKHIDFSSAETVEATAFYSNYALEYADFPKAKSIGATAFIACTNLKALILRRTDVVCTLANINALNQTPIERGTGYIYVPAALVEQYKAATNWSTYASQFRAIEDYPEITGG